MHHTFICFLQFRGHGLFHLNFILLAMFINCMTWNNWNKGIKITNQNHFQIIRKQEASSYLLLLFIASHIVYNIWRCLRYLPAERHLLNVCAAFEIKIEVWIEIVYQIYFDFNNYHNNPNKIYFLNHKTKTKRTIVYFMYIHPTTGFRVLELKIIIRVFLLKIVLSMSSIFIVICNHALRFWPLF